MSTSKTIHTVVLDTGPIITNDPPLSKLQSTCETIVTTPAVISEIKDKATRARVESTLLPFLTLRTPRPGSLKVVIEFARRSGDLGVLSRADLELLALVYEVEVERAGGDWGVRKVPGAKVGTKPEVKEDEKKEGGEVVGEIADKLAETSLAGGVSGENGEREKEKKVEAEETNPAAAAAGTVSLPTAEPTDEAVLARAETAPAQEPTEPEATAEAEVVAENDAGEAEAEVEGEDEDEDDIDEGGWITPSNIKKHQEKDGTVSAAAAAGRDGHDKPIHAALVTADFAMQNVCLGMNLTLVSGSGLRRVRHVRSYILRCHACFFRCKDTTAQFCPRCGGPTLTRVTCVVSAGDGAATGAKGPKGANGAGGSGGGGGGGGQMKLFLKKNIQWNTRGDRFSIPKPIGGSANGKVRDGKRGNGGKGGWGRDLVLAPDQKEYLRAVEDEKRQRRREVRMDEDDGPGLFALGGGKGPGRHAATGRPKIGAGRTVNARRTR